VAVRAVRAVLRSAVATEAHVPHRVGRLHAPVVHLAPEDVRGLAASAAWHGVSGYVLRRLPPGLTGSAEAQRLIADRDAAVFQHLRTIADLRFLDACLGEAVPWLVLKGPALAASAHGEVGLRPYVDLDVLVPPRHLEAAIERLTVAGAEVQDRNWTLLRDTLKGEVHLRLPQGTHLDLHWHLLNDAPIRDQFTIGIAGLFDRRRSVDVDGATVPTLGGVDTIAYVALHALLSGAHRLIWLKDLERLFVRRLAAPGDVARRARAWGAQLPVCAAVDRAAVAIDGWRPPASLGRGAPPADRVWRTVLRGVWHAVPAEGELGRGSPARLAARGVRSGAVRSAATTADKVRAYRRDRGSASRRDRPAVTDAGSDRFPSGGVEERAEFLAAVARHPDGDRW
jgi:hypothetical protein